MQGGADLIWCVGVMSRSRFPSVAPMMDWTDNHYRTLARFISRHAWLYTEMVVAETIVHHKDNLVSILSCKLSTYRYWTCP
jgi:tRNA-dihydrouridine synthase